MAKRLPLYLGASALSTLSLALPLQTLAESNFSAGIWGTYAYLPDDETSKDTWGAFEGEALILYADGVADEGEGRWLYSAEMRLGPGSFTDPANNSTGDQFTLHKAWVGWQLNDDHVIRVGKSQVPFGWKTYNFWPGDILLAGFGDQMDVGVKLSGERGRWDYDAALYLADDWGSTSTDTVDDNGHWGSSNTFRKVQTWVGNLEYGFLENQTLGLSLQTGKLQDLTDADPGMPGAQRWNDSVDGDHQAAVVHYQASWDQWYAKASWITMERELPSRYVDGAGLAPTIENSRFAAEIGYDVGDWSYYVDFSQARPDTAGSTADNVTSIAPGFRYDYGPGWVYVEYLTQDGFVDRNGQVGEGDFDALYVSLDFYL
ncbi:porin [Marinimicrobium locisalis]|uniref:porin n=1 Tax=Marinimicrobium locisalis TaxID=546022 RepID=UPI003221B191